MSDHIEVIDDHGHIIGWCRAVHESVDTPRVILHEWEPVAEGMEAADD